MANLEEVNIKRKDKTCACFTGTGFVYSLPIELQPTILSYLSNLGSPSISFEKTSLLKIENPDLIITGLKRLKEVRFSLKDTNRIDLLQIFEEDLVKYVENERYK
jgi:hypothetical protein